MRFFDFLLSSKRRTRVELAPDHIWMTKDAKFTGIVSEARRRTGSDTVAILLVAHFPDVLASLEEVASQLNEDVPCRAVAAANLGSQFAAGLTLDEFSVIEIHVGERHPLLSEDELIAEFAEGLPCRCRLTHHVSLDDAVMRVFAGAWVKTALYKLGMTAEESISSRMVTRRLRDAQRKIERQATGNLQSASANDWLEKNCQNMARLLQAGSN